MNRYSPSFRLLFLWILTLPAPGILAQPVADFPLSTPEAEGIASAGILRFVEAAEQEVDAIHSFMILRHGKLVSQGWWEPFQATTPHLMYSLSKSFTSTAVGLAIAEGKLSLTDQVISFFPELAPANPSDNLKAMRIVDLLTMNTGHIVEPRPQSADDNWVQYFLASTIDFKPGTHFQYNSMATYMLSAIVQKVTGETLVDYLRPRLFEPLQIQQPEWDSSPQGINAGGWGLRIRTEDIARLGQLYLQQGMWQGKQILSAEWVAMASARQVSNGSNPNSDWEQGYGFQFWQCRHNCYRGDGAFGQFCIVIPEHDAVVAITAGTDDMGRIMNLVWDHILPAMNAETLPAAPAQLAALREKTQHLTLSPVVGESSSPLVRKLAKKTFVLAENDEGVKSISFDLQKDNHEIRLELADGPETLPIGSHRYQSGKLNDHLPYAGGLKKSVGASGAWVKPDEYQVRIYFYETPTRLTYTFRFAGEEMTWDTQWEFGFFGGTQPKQLQGKGMR